MMSKCRVEELTGGGEERREREGRVNVGGQVEVRFWTERNDGERGKWPSGHRSGPLATAGGSSLEGREKRRRG